MIFFAPSAARRVVLVAAALAITAPLSACSHSTSSRRAPLAPAVSSPVSTVSSPASPQPDPSAASASPTPSRTARGEYDDDLAVAGVHAYFEAVSDAVNARNARIPALLAASTANQQKYDVKLLKEHFGKVSPGPFPFTVTDVVVHSASKKTVRLCAQSRGWYIDPKTKRANKPSAQLKPIEADMVKAPSRWKLDGLFNATFSCKGVKLP